jgi:hypothetical protein
MTFYRVFSAILLLLSSTELALAAEKDISEVVANAFGQFKCPNVYQKLGDGAGQTDKTHTYTNDEVIAFYRKLFGPGTGLADFTKQVNDASIDHRVKVLANDGASCPKDMAIRGLMRYITIKNDYKQMCVVFKSNSENMFSCTDVQQINTVASDVNGDSETPAASNAAN